MVTHLHFSRANFSTLWLWIITKKRYLCSFAGLLVSTARTTVSRMVVRLIRPLCRRPLRYDRLLQNPCPQFAVISFFHATVPSSFPFSVSLLKFRYMLSSQSFLFYSYSLSYIFCLLKLPFIAFLSKFPL